MAASPFAAVLTLTRIMQGFTLEGGVRVAAAEAVPKAVPNAAEQAAEQAAAPQLPHSPRPVSAPAAMAADPLLLRPPKIRRTHGGPGNVAAALAAIDGQAVRATMPPLASFACGSEATPFLPIASRPAPPVLAPSSHPAGPPSAQPAMPSRPAGPPPPIRRPALRPRMLLLGRAGHVPPPAFGGCRLPVPEVM
jgi:hypothetical protein